MTTVQWNHSSRSGPFRDKTPSIHSVGPQGLSTICSACLCPLCQLVSTFPWLGKRKLGLGERRIPGGEDSHIYHLKGGGRNGCVCVCVCDIKVNLSLSVLMHTDTHTHPHMNSKASLQSLTGQIPLTIHPTGTTQNWRE